MPVKVPRQLCGHHRFYKLEELGTALFKEVLSRKHVLPPFPGKASSHQCRQKQRTWFGNILDKSMFIRELTQVCLSTRSEEEIKGLSDSLINLLYTEEKVANKKMAVQCS